MSDAVIQNGERDDGWPEAVATVLDMEQQYFKFAQSELSRASKAERTRVTNCMDGLYLGPYFRVRIVMAVLGIKNSHVYAGDASKTQIPFAKGLFAKQAKDKNHDWPDLTGRGDRPTQAMLDAFVSYATDVARERIGKTDKHFPSEDQLRAFVTQAQSTFTYPFRSMHHFLHIFSNAYAVHESLSFDAVQSTPHLMGHHPARQYWSPWLCSGQQLQQLTELFDRHDLLVLTGVAGAGKRTLISEFIRQHIYLQVVIFVDCNETLSSSSSTELIVDTLYQKMRAVIAPDDRSENRLDRIERIRYWVREETFLLVFDNLQMLEYPAAADAHAIRNEMLLSLLDELSLRRTKIILITTDLPAQLSDMAGTLEVHPVAIGTWYGYGRGSETARKKFDQLVSELDPVKVPTTLMRIAVTALSLAGKLNDPEELENAFARLKRQLRRRSINWVVDILVGTANKVHADLVTVLSLIALGEDGLRRTTLTTITGSTAIDLETVLPYVDEFVSLIEQVGPTPEFATYHMDAVLREHLVKRWENTAETLAKKRHFHYEIAQVALREFDGDVPVEVDSVGPLLRPLQAYVHLLASIDPAAIQERTITLDTNLNHFQPMVQGQADDVMRLNYAIGLWKAIDGQDVPGYERRLSRSLGADAIRLDSLMRLFHLGSYFPDAASSLESVVPLLPDHTPFKTDTTGFWFTLLEDMVWSALRSHRFALARSITEKTSRFTAGKRTRELRRAVALIDLHLIEGRLQSAEEVARESAERIPVATDHAKNLARIQGRIAWLLHLQGSTTRTRAMLNALISEEQIHVSLTTAKTLLHFGYRYSQLPDDELREMAVGDRAIHEDLKRFVQEGKSRNNARTVARDRRVRVLLLRSLISRAEFDASDHALDTLEQQRKEAMSSAWSNAIPPMVRVELMEEDLRSTWLIYKTLQNRDLNEPLPIEIDLGASEGEAQRLVANLDRSIFGARARGYPLVLANALLLRAEIVQWCSLREYLADYAKKYSVGKDLDEVSSIIRRSGYALRWRDLDMIETYAAPEDPLPSEIYGC